MVPRRASRLVETFLERLLDARRGWSTIFYGPSTRVEARRSCSNGSSRLVDDFVWFLDAPLEDLRAGDDLGTRQDELTTFRSALTGSAATTLTDACIDKSFVYTP